MANGKDNPDNDATNAKIDWDAFEMPEIKELPDKVRAVIEIPAALIRLAQASRDSSRRMEMSFRGNLEAATEFARLMRSAGDHTVPVSSMTVTQDGIVVRYRAGDRRGRKGKAE